MFRRVSIVVATLAVLALTWAPAGAQPAPFVAAHTNGVVSLVPAPQTTPPPPPSGDNLTIYAASSLTNAFQEIGALYEERTGWAVDFNFGASSALQTQLQQGAVSDVFASADTKQMGLLVTAGLNAGTPAIFAKNRLVVVMPANNPAGITDLHDLAKPGLKFVTTDPAVPIGAYTLQVLDKLSADPGYGSDFRGKVEANIVSHEDNVRGILSKVALGEADAGITYISDTTAAPGQVAILSIPDQFNVIAMYPIVGLQGAHHPDQAALFQALVLAPEGQAILAHYGFVPVNSTIAPV